MAMGNLGLQFYKLYYAKRNGEAFDPRKFNGNESKHQVDERNESHFRSKNRVFLDYQLSSTDLQFLDNQVATHRLFGTTVYPGLLAGSGYAHETGTKEEFKLGFFFDHTTGLPIIPGSSVKGVLRSVFPKCPVQPADTLVIDETKAEDMKMARSRAIFIWNLCNKINTGRFPEIKKSEDIVSDQIELMHKLEYEIFASVDWEKTTEERRRNADKRVCYFDFYHRDVFFDACISKKKNDNAGKRIFANDFITPHKHPKKPELDQFANPIPIQFLKILPNVTFRFDFLLQDSKVCPELTAVNKVKLFENILLTLGIGAKTRVGYGQFIKPSSPQEVFHEKVKKHKDKFKVPPKRK